MAGAIRGAPSDRIESTVDTGLARRWVRRTALSVVIMSVVAIQPVLAQSDPICEADNLPGMIEGFFQLTIALGIIGFVIVWQADALLEMFTLDPQAKKSLEQHKTTALKSTVVLLVLGPLYTVAGSIMNLPLADCVNLAPW